MGGGREADDREASTESRSGAACVGTESSNIAREDDRAASEAAAIAPPRVGELSGNALSWLRGRKSFGRTAAILESDRFSELPWSHDL